MEEWKPVVGYEELYRVSDCGNVMSIRYGGKNIEKLLSQGTDNNGYKLVALHKLGIGKSERVHRMVAQAFIPNPENKRTVNHKDCNPGNNMVENLEWCTHSENSLHAWKTGLSSTEKITYNKGKMHPNSVGIVQYTKEGIFIKDWYCQADVQRTLGIHQSDISSCCRGIQKSAGGFIWKYK